MSLFDHIKKKSDSKEEPNKNEPLADIAETQEPYSSDSVSSDNEIFSAESDNQEFESMNDKNTSESASFSETNKKETAPLAAKRFSVGIDLGTTHCVLSYADITDIDDLEFSQQVMAIPQLTSPGVVEDSLQLPSFL